MPVRSALPIVLLLLVGSPQPGVSQCQNWTETLTASFLSAKADSEALKSFSSVSAEQFSAERTAHERQGVRDLTARSIHHPALPSLKTHLRQLYQAGADLYGVHLDPEQIYILPGMELNAFATGGHIFFYEGIILYYTDPVQFLVRSGMAPRNLPREAHMQLASRFSWRNDWDSLYFVLAHEASHNLMRHGDEEIVERMRSELQHLASDARAHRKAVAEGRSSTGVKHYLAQSLRSFLSGPVHSRRSVSQEEEADAVGSEILRRTGLRPESGITWLQRMSILESQPRTSWQRAMNSVFCSTHPDRQQRMSNLQRNVSCIRSGGAPCEQHIAYPVSNGLEMFQSGFATIEDYHRETEAVAEGSMTPFQDVYQTVELRPSPKDASMQIDGQHVQALSLTLPAGRHILTSSRKGYMSSTVVFAVFPDVPKPTVKVKLKKCKSGRACAPESSHSP